MRYFFFLLYFFNCFISYAGTITVTSNSENGSGSLREAVSIANNNGITDIDTIVFNIPSSTTAGRTILVSSPIVLTSNIVIDGTTQPSSSFGVSDTKIILKSSNSTYGLYLQNLFNVQVYGIWFTKFYYLHNLTLGEHGYAVFLHNVKKINFGQENKGNAFSNKHISIFHKAYFGNDWAADSAYADTVNINYNIFHLNENATELDATTNSISYLTDAVQLSNAKNVNINFNKGSAFISVLCKRDVDAGFVNIVNNNFSNPFINTQYGYSSILVSLYGTNVGPPPLPIYTKYKATIKNNKISNFSFGDGVVIFHVGGNIEIDSNDIYSINDSINGNPYSFNSDGIQIQEGCPGSVLKITNNTIRGTLNGIYTNSTNRYFISKNSIYCTNKGISLNNRTYSIPTVTDLTYNQGLFTGTATPNCKIELFSTNECTEYCENGKTYLGTTTSNNTGNFTFPVQNFQGTFTATATTPDSLTSEFYGIKIDTLNLQIKDATCGLNNGTITGINFNTVDSFVWVNEMNQIVSTIDTNLTNLSPGFYKLKLYKNGLNCHIETGFFEVKTVSRPVLNTNQIIKVDPTCNQPNGKIKYMGTTNNDSYFVWTSQSGSIIASYIDSVQNLPAGTYSLKKVLYIDTSCFSSPESIILSNQNGPQIDISSAIVTNPTCNNSNGSILGVSGSGFIGAINIQWLDSLNNVVGTNFNLTNVQAGKYRIRIVDQSGCPAFYSNYFLLVAQGQVNINTSNVIIVPTTCSGNNGSITGITTTNGLTFSWKNLITNQVIGTSLNISGLGLGSYQLNVISTLGCVSTSPIFAIVRTPFIPISVLTFQIKKPNCNLANGSILITSFNSNPNNHTFKWIDSSTNSTISQTLSLNNINSGTYILIAKDSNGCEDTISKYRLTAIPKPYFTESNVIVKGDTCNLSLGSIQNISIENVTNPTTFSWIKIPSNSIVGNSININSIGFGTYQLKASDSIGCTIYSQLYNIANYNQNLSPALYNNEIIPKNSSTILRLKNNEAGNYVYILYSDSLGLNELQRNSTGNFNTGILSNTSLFYVKKIQGNCFSNITKVVVTVIEKSMVFVPTIFTPNADGKNDILEIKVFGQIRIDNFTIYNRFGQKVFTSQNPLLSWNGYFKNKLVDMGTYIWSLKAFDELNNKIIFQKGTVVLVR